jgi:hypothetical protein
MGQFMAWQLAIVVLIVAVAAAYLVRQTWRTWTSAGCRGGCGCSRTQAAPPEGKVTLIPADQLTLRRRADKG